MKKVGNTLYKLDNKGIIREWEIFVSEVSPFFYSVLHGVQNGKKQFTKVVIEAGKNIGRSNETTAAQQCLLEAESLYNKQRDRKGYTEEIPTEKPFLPMLAQDFKKHEAKINYPACISAKIDGCVDGGTLLKTKSHGILSIEEMVKNKIDCKVLSFNEKTKRKEYKKVLNYFENRNIEEQIEWFEITTENGKTLKLTGNHKVFLPELQCWRRVDELTVDEKLMEI